MNWKIKNRFHELVMKEALQTITKEERAKLERYRQLRRNGREKPPANERLYWEGRCCMKMLTMFALKSEGKPYSWPKYPPTKLTFTTTMHPRPSPRYVH